MDLSSLRFSTSVQNNSNRIIGSSEEKFVGIRDGNLIRFNNENELYTILKKENVSYVKNFDVINLKTIALDEFTGIKLQVGDTLKINYKEYELLAVCDFINRGINYNNEDELKVEGGELILDISSGMVNPTILQVIEIDKEGKVLEIGIKEKGKYIKVPNNPCKVSGGSGTGIEFDLRYTELESFSITERTIQNITFKNNKTYLVLDYSLPINLKKGNFSVEKSCLILTSPYLGPTQLNINYQVYRDFTPSLNIPLMVKNSSSPDIIFNKAMKKIDEEISIIKRKLGI
jgi:hypothetical protein